MSRRRSRLRNELSLLADDLASLDPVLVDAPAGLTRTRDHALSLVRNFLLPRLALDRPPIVLALVGSTGAGKSTILNSLAGQIVSPVGVLRPTTKTSRYWTSENHAPIVAPLVADVERSLTIGHHPLLESLVLVDTPDIDSDLADHREEAMFVADTSDALLFVTTAARYGDAVVWATITELARQRSSAVLLNRVPSRASGARNDLMARLRDAGLSEVPVFTISEQRIDPAKGRLSPQSVQRVAAYLRAMPADTSALDHATAEIQEALDGLLAWLAERNERAGVMANESRAALQQARAAVDSWRARQGRLPWRRSRLLPANLQRAYEEASVRASDLPVIVSVVGLEEARQSLANADYEGLWS